MKTIVVPARAKVLNELLKAARQTEVILESADGQRFVLISIEDWEGFEVDEDDDITQNKDLMEYLAKRRSQGNRIPLAGVKAQLGLS